LIETRLIAKFMDGRIRKGYSDDFLLLNETFHMSDTPDQENQEEISMSDLKAVFFVDDFAGNPQYVEKKRTSRLTYHNKISIRFHDGEEIIGYANDDYLGSDVIRIVPADPLSNNTLIFVVRKNTVSILPLEE